jgi:o-aminophenol oxidase
MSSARNEDEVARSGGWVSRRGFLVTGGTLALGTGVGSIVPAAELPDGQTPDIPGVSSPTFTELTPFVDPLPTPPVAVPRRVGDTHQLTIPMVNASRRLHSQLPPTPLWTYGGSYPGPTIEVRRGQRLRVTWANQLRGPIPVTAVEVPNSGNPWNSPGRGGATPRPDVANLPPWTAVHLHGALTPSNNDGWPENVISTGDSQLSEYPNNQAAAALFYHDHAMSITRWNVFAGLSGAYIIRDEEEDRLGLPSGEAEISLFLSDRNFDTDDQGRLNGKLLHKISMVNDTGWHRAFTGPFTLVNGVVWPYKEVSANWHRLRISNAANTRQYRLRLLDESGGDVPMHQIGTDGGLLDAPVELSAGITLASAERADVLVDFGLYRGQRLEMVNAETNPDPGPWPHVLQFRVGEAKTETFRLPGKLSPSFEKVTRVPGVNPPDRLVVLTPMGPTQSLLWEMVRVPTPSGPLPVDGIVQLVEDDGSVTTYQRQSVSFADPIRFTVLANSWERWRFLHTATSGWPHPMHVHVTNFQVLRRDALDLSGFKSITNPDGSFGFGTESPITISSTGPALPGEHGWKDTVRVQAAELVTVAAQFAGSAGRFVYHCHMLEHEDMGMMRQFRVLPHELHQIEMRDDMSMPHHH